MDLVPRRRHPAKRERHEDLFVVRHSHLGTNHRLRHGAGQRRQRLRGSLPEYLRYPWGSGSSCVNPTARADFGVYNQPVNAKKIIYRREVR